MALEAREEKADSSETDHRAFIAPSTIAFSKCLPPQLGQCAHYDESIITDRIRRWEIEMASLSSARSAFSRLDIAPDEPAPGQR